MILDRDKTIALLTDKVLELKVGIDHDDYIYCAVGINDIWLSTTENNEVKVYSDMGWEHEMGWLDDETLEYYCSEYKVTPIYDVKASIDSVKNYMAKIIKEKIGFYEEYDFYSDYVQEEIAEMSVESLHKLYKHAVLQ